MPALPTITVTDDQAARLLAAFGSVPNYLTWLTDSLIDKVMQNEANIIEQETNVLRQQRLEALRASLPPRSTDLPAASG
jgi:hypothetical protein